jgi:hypothetical protein
MCKGTKHVNAMKSIFLFPLYSNVRFVQVKKNPFFCIHKKYFKYEKRDQDREIAHQNVAG